MQTTRKQLSVQLSVLLATICTVFLLVGGAADAGGGPAPSVQYVVAQGDTLWEVAAQHLGPDQDVRPLIQEIKDLSGIQSSALEPGQILQIPQP